MCGERQRQDCRLKGSGICSFAEPGDSQLSFDGISIKTGPVGDLVAPGVSPSAIRSVLLQTTRIDVNWATVSSVPSQAVTRSTYPRIWLSMPECPVLASAQKSMVTPVLQP